MAKDNLQMAMIKISLSLEGYINDSYDFKVTSI